MATFIPFDTPGHKDRFRDAGNLMHPSFAPYPGRWVYCNYPERLPADGSALGDADRANRCLNEVEVEGLAQVFASYLNDMSYAIYFGIRLYNPGATEVRVTLLNNGFRHSGAHTWCDTAVGVWRDFFANRPGTRLLVRPGRSIWLFERFVPGGAFFNGVVRFETSGRLWCTAYVYRQRAQVDGSATLYPWTPGHQYRGCADRFMMGASVDLQVSQLPAYWYSHLCGKNEGEMIAITDPQGPTFSCDNEANLGNWGAQYIYRLTLTNDTTSNQTIRLWAGAGNIVSTNECINYGGQVDGGCCGSGEIWNFLVDTLPTGATERYEFQHIHCANGYSPLYMRVTAER